MKISISNIAWNKDDDEQMYEILKENSIYGLDVAPARVFDKPFEISVEQGQAFNETVRNYGLTPVGMQSLLFGTDGLSFFGEEAIRRQTIEHLKKMMDYAKKIGVTRLIFGSPRNRLVGKQSKDEIKVLSTEIFNELGNYALERSLYFCIEPNPVEYGADFVTTTKEGIKLVKSINNPGFRLHMDLGTMIMNDENMEEVIGEGLEITEHVHLSHPNLEQVIGREEVHEKFYRILKEHNYRGTLAIEMKNSMQQDNLEKVKSSIEFISRIYGGNDE